MTTDSAPSAPNVSDEMHDLGVLFVHGIGEQQQGATLVAFGEPLYRWVGRWFDGVVRSWAHVELRAAQESAWFERHSSSWLRNGDPRTWSDAYETRLRLAGHLQVGGDPTDQPAVETLRNDVAGGVLAARTALRDVQARQASTGTPSHAVMELHALATDGVAHRARWLLTESWWAQTFFEPSRSDLATWLIMVVPWSLGSHFGVRVRRARQQARVAASGLAQVIAWGRVGGHLGVLAASLPLAVLIEVLVGLVVLIGLIPIPVMRRVLLAAEQLLARTLGDSFVLVSSPLQQAAIVAQVQRDVSWLASRCHTVAVIAHSQGGAVAHRALRHGRPPNVRLLCTLGSGLRKLEEMEHIVEQDDGLYGRVYLTAAAVLLGAYAVWATIVQAQGALLSAAAGGGLFAFLVVSYLSRAHALDASWFTMLLREPGLWWADFHATADPVSNGALDDFDMRTGADGETSSAAPGTQPLSVSICNERSLTRDHTTYWQNAEEFVAPVVLWLTWLTPGPWHGMVSGPLAHRNRAAAIARRRWRVGALVVSRWVAGLAVAAVLAGQWAAWLRLARWASADVPPALGAILPGAMPAPLLEGAVAPVGLGVWASTLGPLVAIFLISGLCRRLWDRWGDLEQRAYFRLRPTTCAAASAPRTDTMRASIDVFSTVWFFFSAVGLHGLVVLLAVPALSGGWRPDAWTTASSLSAIGLAAAIVSAMGSWRAVARARAPVPVTSDAA